MKQFYRTDKIKETNADFYLVYGKKGNGKSSALYEECIRNYWERGKQFVWMRRWNDDFMGSRAKNFFSDLVGRGVVEEITGGKWNNIVYYQRAWYLAKEDAKGKTIKDSTPAGFAYALTSYEHQNGVQYPEVDLLVFDEFLTDDELADEFTLFMKCYSNIRRSKTYFKCWLLGNTVTYFSTYWLSMGIDNVRTQKKNTIDVYTHEYKQYKIKIACEYCGLDNDEEVDESEVAIKVFENNNSQLAMITNGDFEIYEYSRPPQKNFHNWNIKYRCFLEFFEYFFAIDLIKDDEKNIYLYVHPHDKNDIKDKSIIYGIDTFADKWHKKNILLADTPVERRIVDLIKHDKIFYANNITGNVFNAYLKRC